jgi:DNA replication protein DnaC
LAEWAGWLKINPHDDWDITALITACADFASAFKADPDSPRWISILGNTGTGKTHCARRLWIHLSNRLDWRKAQFNHYEIFWPRFVADLRAGDSFDLLRDMMRWPVLFLDDIGAERDTTGFASEQLNALVGARENRWTIITSNLLLDQLGAIDPRIPDRMIRRPNICVEIQTMSHAIRTLNAQPPTAHNQLPPSDR